MPPLLRGVRLVNLAVRFLLELSALASVALWGATLQANFAERTAVAVLLVTGVGVLWGLFVSPKARVKIGVGGRAGLGMLVFLAAAAALCDRGHEALGAAVAIVSIISSLLFYLLPQ